MSIVYFNPIFQQNAECLAKLLQIPRLSTLDSDNISKWYIIIGPHEQANQLLSFQRKHQCRYILLNTESYLSNAFRNKYYIHLLQENIVLDYNGVNAPILKRKFDIRVICQYPMLFIGDESPKPLCKDIDILFIGTKSARREEIFEKLKRQYPTNNIVFEMEWKLNRNTDLLQRAKYVLNIPFYEHQILETHRIHQAMACGCHVVSLYSGNKIIDNFYKDYITFTHDIVNVFRRPIKPPIKTYNHLIQKMDLPQFRWFIEMVLSH